MQQIPQLSDHEYAVEVFRDAVRQVAIFHPSEIARDAAEAVLDNLKISTLHQLFNATAGTAAYAKLIVAWHDMRTCR